MFGTREKQVSGRNVLLQTVSSGTAGGCCGHGLLLFALGTEN